MNLFDCFHLSRYLILPKLFFRWNNFLEILIVVVGIRDKSCDKVGKETRFLFFGLLDSQIIIVVFMDFDHHIKFECLNSLLEDYLFVFYLLKEFPEII